MPISADRFEEIDNGDDGRTPGMNPDEILSFLQAHADQAFTQTEIAAATGVNRRSVGPTLVRLREDGRVDHKGTYWRVSDHAGVSTRRWPIQEQSLRATTNHRSRTTTGWTMRSIRVRTVRDAYQSGGAF